ncbi:MAG: hypothetical protein ING36_06365 [Burkholderiales bacterium]|nr:hypothetical protein [Burkholderiales bacterium]
MFSRIVDGKNKNITSLKKNEQVQTIDDVFSEIIAEAQNFNVELKRRFIDAYFYTCQRDIQEAMTDFDRLDSADRLIAGYFLRRLVQCAELSLHEKSLSVPRKRRSRSKLARQSSRP